MHTYILNSPSVALFVLNYNYFTSRSLNSSSPSLLGSVPLDPALDSHSTSPPNTHSIPLFRHLALSRNPSPDHSHRRTHSISLILQTRSSLDITPQPPLTDTDLIARSLAPTHSLDHSHRRTHSITRTDAHTRSLTFYRHSLDLSSILTRTPTPTHSLDCPLNLSMSHTPHTDSNTHFLPALTSI